MAIPESVTLLFYVAVWYVCNTFYNIYNKKALNQIHAHWTVAFTQLVVGVVWCMVIYGLQIRKFPKLKTADWVALAPIGLFAAASHGGSVLALGAGSVSFAQIVKACEPVFAAIIALAIPPQEIKPALAYMMLLVIVGGVGLACVKEGKGVEINMYAFGWASFANLAAALKGKLGKDVTHNLKADKSKNMDAANVYAVMNVLSAAWTLIVVLATEAPTIQGTWDQTIKDAAAACKKDPKGPKCYTANDIIINVVASGVFFYLYNEFAFAFTAKVGPVTSSVLNTLKRVIIIVVTAIVFGEIMDRNAMIGSGVAIAGTMFYSLAEMQGKNKAKKA
jgi:solute carrier family 35 protein E1|mmetsp:Transcript_1529/g.3872  ORF Transcript_1529/g.3872 Transcript_1529/m.3872 type:complete len:334 (-) Transcript_1529:36-1037(-)|eukprot:CAMPEP_0173434418 /NCGR_PEP_ID=MMETSP1357-20121228/12862_1 /TAXON_ID=77926 /ORGANISM="Hemiselmis rufescens, Strain PCC563" /LENGTH=333 /DNA_ID=CAMNT_0014399269 /DNA_START=26 /DNA_END=1027 /DNA_ORIENTATION=+